MVKPPKMDVAQWKRNQVPIGVGHGQTLMIRMFWTLIDNRRQVHGNQP